jgi:hypothetical protein
MVQTRPDTLPELLEVEYVPQPESYGPGAGLSHYSTASLRCGRCDGRYCFHACYAGEPGYAYVTGHGWEKEEQAWQIAIDLAEQGFSTRIEVPTWSAL